MISPWLDTEDAAEYLRYKGSPTSRRKSVYRFLARNRIITRTEGRRVLIARADIDAVLDIRQQLHRTQANGSMESAGSPVSGLR